jgi:hypothetical protein
VDPVLQPDPACRGRLGCLGHLVDLRDLVAQDHPLDRGLVRKRQARAINRLLRWRRFSRWPLRGLQLSITPMRPGLFGSLGARWQVGASVRLCLTPEARSGGIHPDISLAGPSVAVLNVGVIFTRPISPAPVLSPFLAFLTPSGSDFTSVLNSVLRFSKTSRTARCCSSKCR